MKKLRRVLPTAPAVSCAGRTTLYRSAVVVPGARRLAGSAVSHGERGTSSDSGSCMGGAVAHRRSKRTDSGDGSTRRWTKPAAYALGAVLVGGLVGSSSDGADEGAPDDFRGKDDSQSHVPVTTPTETVVRKAKRVAVIGAGASGLICAKCLLDEGLEVVVFEQEPYIGGLWRYKDSTEGHGGCYRSLRTLSTQRMTSFKDHPIEEWIQKKEKKSLLKRLHSSLSPWAHHSQVLAYLEDFAETHALSSITRFNTRVLKVSPCRSESNEKPNCWRVSTIDRHTGEQQTADFDAVAVCHGHHWHPIMPNVPGMDSFKGRQIHSREYRHPDPFKGQRVVVVGMGDSGSAIADEVSSVAEVTYLSTSRDMLPLNPWKRHFKRQTLKPRISQVREHTVLFNDESEVEADVIIYCTGYRMSFPFLTDEQLLPIRSNRTPLPNQNADNDKVTWLPCGEKTALFRRVIHPDYPALAFIGLVDVHLFSVFPVSEVQSKWFACTLSGRCRLPPREHMLAEIAEWEDSVRSVCYQPLLIDGISYIKQIKREVKQEKQTALP